MKKTKFFLPAIVSILWINAIEIARYYLVEQAALQEYWTGSAKNIATDTALSSTVWMLWGLLVGAILVRAVWLVSEKRGYNYTSAFIAGTFSWGAMFLLFWVGVANLNLVSWSMLPLALVVSWLELVSAAVIFIYLSKKKTNHGQ